MPLREILVVQHSHTDLGFTHDRPVVKELHGRFLEEAMDLAEREADHVPGERFVWTVETCGVLDLWLRKADDAQVARLQRLERAGLIEVMALHDHQTPLADTADAYAALRTAERLRQDYGFRIEHAMNCDVNGVNWPAADAMLDAGVRGYTTAINRHFGKAPLRRPAAFAWQAPSGRLLPSYVGMPYGFTGKLGIGADSFATLEGWLPRLEGRLAEDGYPLSVVLFQHVAPFGDNGPADPSILAFVRRWNAEGRTPRLRLATMREWWKAVAADGGELKVHRGDWTDSWNFGAITKARELGSHRRTRARLRSAELLQALNPDARSREPLRRAADAYHEYHEHTWSVDSVVGAPWSVDAWAQDAHKSALAATAHSLATMVLRDGLAELARRVERERPDDVLVVNPLPFARTVSGLVPGGVSHPRGVPNDAIAARHFCDRKLDAELAESPARPLNEWHQDPEFMLRPVELPAFGYRVFRREEALLDPFAEFMDGDEAAIETGRYRLTFDREGGGVTSLFDKALGCEWVDGSAPHRFHDLVHERVALGSEHPRAEIFHMDWASPEFDPADGWNPVWPAERRPAGRVLSHRVRRTPLGVSVVQIREAFGVEGSIEQRVFLPAHAEWIELTTRFRLGVDVWPQALYVALPFELSSNAAFVDLGPMAMRPSRDQIPGVQADYFTTQGWADFSNEARGITVATPENPLVQLGSLRFGQNSPRFEEGPAHFYGWVANNYWETNFPAVQPGDVVARYRLLPHAGPLDEPAAHRFGLDSLHATPLLHHLGERPALVRDMPAEGRLLSLETDPSILPLAFERRSDGLYARLHNASDTIASGLAPRETRWTRIEERRV